MAQEKESKVKIQLEGDDIVIRCSIKDLVFIAESDPESGYRIHDENRFADGIVFELENSKSFRNNEGMNAVEELFQNAYEAVYEQGNDDVMTDEGWQNNKHYK